MKKIHTLLLLSLFLQLSNSYCQNNNPLVKESIFLHLNSNTLITGESLYFKLYYFSNLDKQISKIAYIELVDPNFNSITKVKINIENGMGQGDIFIPTTLKTDAYQLIAYTHLMANTNTNLISQNNITIINPYQNFNIFESKLLEDKNVLLKNSEKISELKKEYSNREKVNFKINDLTKGNYSISIKKLEQEIETKTISSKEFKINNDKINLSEVKYRPILPEMRGEIISGKLVSKKPNEDINNIPIALSISGKSFALKIVNTDVNGRFNFILDKEPNSSDCFFQVLHDNRLNFEIILEPKNIDLSFLKFSEKIKITPEIKKIINQRAIANQIENAYYSLKQDTIQLPNNTKPFYFPLGRKLYLKDYTRFSNLKETLTEIVDNAFYKEKKGNFSIHLRDKDNPDENGLTLVLVDGLLIQDIKELFEYDANKIEAIEIVEQKYVYGPKVFHGIINIITKDFDYEVKSKSENIFKLQLNRPLLPKKYFNQDYTNTTLFENIPDYRYQLLWQPELKNNSISFYTSDIKGLFEINIEGFTNDGSPISEKAYFEVN